MIATSSKLLKLPTEQTVAAPYPTCEGVNVKLLGFKNISARKVITPATWAQCSGAFFVVERAQRYHKKGGT